MKFHNLQTYAALSASWISTGICAYLAYYITEPKPIIDINYIPNSSAVIVKVECVNYGGLKEAKVVHRNLDCLEKRGYIVNHLYAHPYESIICIENVVNLNDITDDCVACGVASEIEYKTLVGHRKEFLEWVSQSNNKDFKGKLRLTHKQQNLPEEHH